MFLSFGKKSPSVKKHGSAEESSKVTRSPEAKTTAEAMNGSSKSTTVQTTAGPLLSSSRFNSILDASTFANVNSPGFTSRVVNCATSGSTSHHENSATHQSKYSSVGLFPRVQLGGQSTLPTLSPRISQKVGRTPVRVRIASPSVDESRFRRHSVCGGSSEAVVDKTLFLKRSPSMGQSNVAESVSPTRLREIEPATVENNQELSRKRMFSECQDPCDEAKKRRRKAELPIPNPNNDIYRYRHVRVPAVPSSPPSDISSQGKRAREKGSPEEQKRQKRKMCSSNNAIFSSLSSSRNLLERLTAQKRKSIDISRSSSPLLPLSGKQVKESKTTMDVKATQCNLNVVLQEFRTSENIHQPDSTPISSRVINKRTDPNLKEALEKPLEKTSNEPHRASNSDYTTKLFRKDISSHSPRAVTSKALKQSPWVQAPAADELTCSLLSDDSKVDRPERLKSLLACVSGKDTKMQETKGAPTSTAVSRSTKELDVSKSNILLPERSSSNSSVKALSATGASLSTALTVTVSSTCTIMTSATVTSVNGIPSSESGRSPPPRPVSSVPVQTPLPSPQQTSNVTSSENVVSSIGTVQSYLNSNSVISTSSPVLKPGISITAIEQTSKADSFNNVGVSNGGVASDSVVSKPNFDLFTTKTSVTNPQMSVGTLSIDRAPKSAFQFGTTSSSVTTSTVSTFDFHSSVQPSSTTINMTAPTPALNGSASMPQSTAASSVASIPSFGSTLSAGRSFSFGSRGSASSETPATNAKVVNSSCGVETSVLSKPSSSFGSSLGASTVSSITSNPGFQFGSGVSAQVSKAASEFGANTANDKSSSEVPKPAVQFGLTGTSSGSSSGPTKPMFQFGSNSSGLAETPKPAFQFGSSSNGPSDPTKSTFQFNTSHIGSSDSSKSILQFGPSSANTQKPALPFGSSGGMNATSQSPFGSNNTSLTSSSNPAFQLGANVSNIPAAPKSFQFGSNVESTNDAGKSSFQFGSSLSKPNSSSSSNFQLSSSLNKPNDASKSNFQFSGSFASPQSFGSAPQESGSAFGQVVPSKNKGTFSFGSSNNSGSENKGVFFGSIGTTSANSGPTPSTMFSPGAGSPAFGAPSGTPQSTAFGVASNTKSSEFGSTPSFGGTGSSAFSFNSNGTSTAGSTSSTFQFGSPSTNGSNVGSFSFGQKLDQTTGGFNFNATVTAVPSPAPQASGLFSIGSGPSTAQRRTTTARRRR